MKRILNNIHVLIVLFNLINAQELLYDEAGRQLRSRKVICDVGGDIQGPPFATVILDGSRSQPSNGSLTYEWSFAPNLLFQDDYDYETFDSIIPYTDAETQGLDSNGRISIKKIITRNKYIAGFQIIAWFF